MAIGSSFTWLLWPLAHHCVTTSVALQNAPGSSYICPSPRISHLSKQSWICFLENDTRNKIRVLSLLIATAVSLLLQCHCFQVVSRERKKMVCVWLRAHTHISTPAHTLINTGTNTCTRICIQVYASHRCVCVYTCVYTYLSVFLHVTICVYIWLNINSH